MAPGEEATVVVRVTNNGSTPITDLRMSFHSRVDFRTSPTEAPKTIGPGQTIEATYKMAAPRQINLQCLSNRVAYAHWCAIYRRAKAVHLAHVPVTVSMQD
jgi:hypothetical protein